MTNSARTVLRISGPDSRHFLQGLITNDVEKLTQGMVYAAILTPQGKYLADFFLVPEGDAILMDVDSGQAAALLQRLTMYKLRSAVEIEPTDLTVTRGLGDAPAGAFADPRHPALGWRGYAGQQPGNQTDWDALRVAHGIPQSAIELTPDSFILEVGFERLNGVDFKKGCYVGQEVTARMKHKTELRKGLARVAIEGTAPLGTEILSDGKSAGTLFTQSGGQALAYLRYDRSGENMQAGEAKVHYRASTPE